METVCMKLCKQFGPRSVPTNHCTWSVSKLLDTMMVFLKDFVKTSKFWRKKISRLQKHAKLLMMQRLNEPCSEKTDFYICKHKAVTTQLISAFVFRYMDSTIHLLPKAEISSL